MELTDLEPIEIRNWSLTRERNGIYRMKIYISDLQRSFCIDKSMFDFIRSIEDGIDAEYHSDGKPHFSISYIDEEEVNSKLRWLVKKIENQNLIILPLSKKRKRRRIVRGYER